MARATVSWWTASTSCHTAPVARASRVEPSMSVNRSVMVPTGGSPMAATLAAASPKTRGQAGAMNAGSQRRLRRRNLPQRQRLPATQPGGQALQRRAPRDLDGDERAVAQAVRRASQVEDEAVGHGGDLDRAQAVARSGERLELRAAGRSSLGLGADGAVARGPQGLELAAQGAFGVGGALALRGQRGLDLGHALALK